MFKYFAKTTFGDKFWTVLETAEDSHSPKALGAWIVETRFADDDAEEAASPTRRRNTNSFEFKSVEVTAVEPSVWSFLDPSDDSQDVRTKSSDSMILDADCQLSYYQQHTGNVIWFTQEAVTTTCQMCTQPSGSTFQVLSQACGMDRACLRCAAERNRIRGWERP